jgi:hypothetical protein
MGDSGAIAIADALKVNNTITKLNMSIYYSALIITIMYYSPKSNRR